MSVAWPFVVQPAPVCSGIFVVLFDTKGSSGIAIVVSVESSSLIHYRYYPCFYFIFLLFPVMLH